jgi:tRNA-specific 2-thiouridylase
MNVAGKKIFVGLSGGVDSAVSAALLKEAGAHVTGVFIKGWYPEGLPCTWAEDRREAMRVAARLGIPFETLDASQEYKKAVIDYLIREYAAGRTPNPDIMCNRDVKFGAFYTYAKAHKADYIATGHYARIIHDSAVSRLLRGKDSAKDQSYFLWAIPRSVLRDVLFPLGEMEKTAVRAHAARLKLPNATRRDSQGICFLGPVSIEEFLEHEIGLARGKAIDTSGKEVGSHRGAIAFTLGERARLDGEAGPWYVVAKDLAENIITVAHDPRAFHLRSSQRDTYRKRKLARGRA